MKRKTLILDLDETLLYSVEGSSMDNFDLSFSLDNKNFYTKFRPHLTEFIDFVCSHFDIIVWTSASEDYAKEVTKEIFKGRPYKLLSRKDSNNKIRLPHNMVDSLDYYPKMKAIIKAQSFWGKSTSFYNETELSIKPLKKVLKMFNLDKKDVICLDNDPYKFANSYGNLWSIKDYYGQNDDSELLKYIKLLNEIKDLDDVRSNKIPILKKYNILNT